MSENDGVQVGSVHVLQVEQHEKDIGKPLSRKKKKEKHYVTDTVIQNLKCRQIFSWEVIFLLLLLIGLAAGHLYLYFMYVKGYGQGIFEASYNKEYVWVFLLFSASFMLLFIYLLAVWKRETTRWLKRHYSYHPQFKAQHKEKSWWQKYSDTCGLNGSHFLYRLYFWEFVEHGVYFFNLMHHLKKKKHQKN